MPRPGFYNDNEYRAYPFIFKPGQAEVLPNSAVVDCGVIMGLDSEFDAATHKVWLAEIRRANNVFEFELRTDAPAAQNYPLVFVRTTNADEWLSEQVDADTYVQDGNSCATEPVWSGFLVTGPLQDLNAALPTNGTLTLGQNFVLEPARIQSLVKSYLRSITIGNMSRPQARAACDETNVLSRSVIINARCVDGNIRFKEGYNAQISQRAANNEINISAGGNSGMRPDAELCEYGSEIPFYAGELPPEGSQFFSGGPACDELVSSINGIQGPDITIASGTGVDIKIDPENPNTIKVDLSNTTLTGNCNQ